MDEYPGQPEAPGTPPPPTYQAPPPPAPGAAPGYVRSAAPPKKKTWLWVVIGLVVLGLLGCCGAMALGGFALFGAAGEPADSIEAINQAALDGDSATFEKYFDVDSVTAAAYVEFLDYVKSGEDWNALVAEVGEEEADRILREDIMPESTFIEDLSGELSIEGLGEGEVPFADYTVTATSIENDAAELTIVAVEDGEEVTYVLGMERETVGEESIWVVKEIRNVADLFAGAEASE